MDLNDMLELKATSSESGQLLGGTLRGVTPALAKCTAIHVLSSVFILIDRCDFVKCVIYIFICSTEFFIT